MQLDGTALLLPADLCDYAAARLEVDRGRFVDGPDFPSGPPDQIAVLSFTGGPGLSTGEQAFDAMTLQARVRGGQRDRQSAWLFAWQLDRLFRNLEQVEIGGVWVESIRRLGGAPAPLGPLDESGRLSLTCNYVLLAALDD